MRPANAERGEAQLLIGGRPFVLRPTFEALVAAEAELGSLFQLVDRTAEGRLTLQEAAALLHHVTVGEVSREAVGGAIMEQGLAAITPILRQVLGQVLQGR